MQCESEKWLAQQLKNNIYQQLWWWIWPISHLWSQCTASANKHTHTHTHTHTHIYIYIYIRSSNVKCHYLYCFRTLNRTGQLPELTASAVEHQIDIICLQENRYTHTEDIKYHETGNGWMLVTVSAWKNSVNASVGGVGMLIGPRALKTLNSIERIQPKMMAATFNGNPKATIISCYSPTNISEETELVTFYEELSSQVRSIPKHNLLVIGGYMNAQIGKNRNNKYRLHNTSNRNGQHLIDFMIENRLTYLNTNFQKREGKLWTHTYANKSKAQID